jgi:hypothetical protein
LVSFNRRRTVFFETTKDQAFLFAYGLLAIWLLLILNWWSGPRYGQLMFESPRLQGLTELFWLLIPCIFIGIAMIFGRSSIKLALIATSVLLFLIFEFFGLGLFMVTGCALDQISTNTDPTMDVVDIKRLNSVTSLYVYDYNPGPMGRPAGITCTKTDVVPGVRLVRILKVVRD